MRRRANGPAVALFPFLAVLLCAMGALILLLLILTRQVREDVLQGDTDAAPALPLAAAEPSSMPSVDVVRTRPTADRPIDPNVALRAELAELNIAKKKAAGELARLQEIEDQRVRSVRSAEARMASMTLESDAARQRLAARRASLKEREAERDVLRGGVEQAVSALDAVRVAAASAEPKVSIIPFDGRYGTARRPILIECTGDAIRFLPEDVALTAREIEGFLPDDNPLLAGVIALREHWQRVDGPDAPRPYVLLLIRDDGIAAYYAARSLLSSLNTQTGYELVTDSLAASLELPHVDPAARDACRLAVLEALQSRSRDGVRMADAAPTFPTGRFEVDASEHDPTRDDASPRPSRPAGNPLRDPARSIVPPAPSLAAAAARPGPPPIDPPRQSLPADPKAGISKIAPPDGMQREFTSADTAAAEEFGNTSVQENGSRAPSGSSALPVSRALPSSPRLDVTGPDREPPSMQFGLPPSKQRWGQFAPSANIALERPIGIIVSRDTIVVAEQPPIPIEGITDSQVLAAVFAAIENEATAWGRAPGQFYWKPRLFAKVRPGGTGHFDRLDRRLKAAGLRVSGEIVLETVGTDVTERNHGQATP